MRSENNQLFLNIYYESGTVLGRLHILSGSILTTIKHFYPQFRNGDTEACPGVSAQFFCLLLYYSILVALPASCSVIDSNPTLYQKKGERLEGFIQSTLNCLLVCIRNLWDMYREKYMCKKKINKSSQNVTF